MKEKRITTLQVAGTYIGTIVGAGFASGQEMLHFFTQFGLKGFFGIVIASLLFIYFGYIIMQLGCKLRATSHLQVVKTIGGRLLGSFSDILITFFLFGALTAMIAGSGALLHQEFSLHPLAGSFLMAAITVITVIGGFYNIINSISIVVPFLIISAVGVSIISLLLANPATTSSFVSLPKHGMLRNWIWSAIIYTSYNTVTSIAILAPLGNKVKDKKTIRNGAILGGLGLGIGAAAIFWALYVNQELVEKIEIPMLVIARNISPIARVIYALVLLAEIYTTAVGNLYGFSARICNMNESKANNLILGSSLLAFTASLAGFSNLVKYLYPIVGYCGVLTLFCLVYYSHKKKAKFLK